MLELEQPRKISSITKIYPQKTRMIQYRKPYELPSPARRQKRRENLLQRIDDFRSERRARSNIRDIVLCNRFDLFVTFTFKNARDNVGLCKVRLAQWIRNQQRKHGEFEYIFVPEYHKDGVSLHFHGLLKNYCGTTKDSGIMQSGRKVYNLTEWRNGFSTATVIDGTDEGYEKLASYVTKYITKDMPKFAGKKRYWVSQNLERPETVINADKPYL